MSQRRTRSQTGTISRCDYKVLSEGFLDDILEAEDVHSEPEIETFSEFFGGSKIAQCHVVPSSLGSGNRMLPVLAQQQPNTEELAQLWQRSAQFVEAHLPADATTSNRASNAPGLKSGLTAVQTDGRMIIKPQHFPHAFVPVTHNQSAIKFDELDLRALTLGELEIITLPTIEQQEYKGRIELLKLVLRAAENYEWPAVRNFYKTIVRQIETGSRQWGDNTSEERSLHLNPFLLNKAKPSRASNSKNSGQPNNVFFCLNYQTGKCTLSEIHEAELFGQKVQVRHICSGCLRKNKLEAHPQKSCPDFKPRFLTPVTPVTSS